MLAVKFIGSHESFPGGICGISPRTKFENKEQLKIDVFIF